MEVLRVSLADPSLQSDVLADIQDRLTQTKRVTTRIESDADGAAALVVEIGGAIRSAGVVNCVAAAVAAQDPAPVVLVRNERGTTVRFDSRIVRNPFEMLMAVTTLDPPVGLG